MLHDWRTALLAGAVLAASCSGPAAQANDVRHYDLPAQELGKALQAVALRSSTPIVAASPLVEGRRAPALKGSFSPEAAVALLLAGSGLVARRVDDALVIQRQAAESAQDAQGGGEGAGDETILVTGTRIRGRAPAGAAVTTLDRETIEQSGYATAQQLLQSLPQNFGGGPGETTFATARGNADANTSFGSAVNLRGLGPSSTLVLLNGTRPPMAGTAGIFTDLSMVPLSAVERIEVLPDGASALYGSDAVAGVVNIVPRTRFRGLETSLRHGLGDGVDDVQASMIAGHGWTGGNLVVAYEYYHRSRLAASERPWFSEDLRRYGLGDFRSAAGVPGTIIAGGRRFAIPDGQDGRNLRPADLRPDQSNVLDRYAGADALPDQTRHAVFVSARQSLFGNLELHAEALFGHRNYQVHGTVSRNSATLSVPVANPFYVDPLGTRQNVAVSYSLLRELGPESTRGFSRGLGATVGATLDLGAWRIDLSGTHGRQDEGLTIYNLLNTARAAQALADTNAATALNLFGDGSANNPATIERLRGSLASGSHYRLWSAQLRADGPLFRLPAGDLRLALGVEHRRERYVADRPIADITTLTPTVLPGAPLDAARSTSALYAELAVPLSGPGAGLGIGRLDLSLALRAERHSRTGDTANPKFGAAWEPVRGLALRGTFGTSFRAPSFSDLRQDATVNAYFAYPIPNPAVPGGVTNTLVIRGNDPDIGPERATSWTAGLDIRAREPTGPHAQLTWFDIHYRDRIVSPSSALLSFFTNRAVYAPIIDEHPDPAAIAAFYASPSFLRLTNIPASAITATVDARTQNLAEQRMSGLDFDLGYRFGLAEGSAEIGVSGSYLAEFRQRLTPGAPAVVLVDTIGNPPDLRLRGRATLSTRGYGVALFANYIDGYVNSTSGTARPVGSWTTIDAQLSYRTGDSGPLRHLMIALSATNLLNQEPPRTAYLLGTSTIGFDVENASPLGRIFALQVTKRW
nr:TonB-dependent receptor [uncultured Sphingomonas sp.]